MKNRKLFALTSLATVSLATIVGCAKENLNTVPVNTAEPVASVSALSDADVENAMFDLVDLPAKEEEVDAPKNDTDTMKDLGLYVDNDETILTEEEKARRRQTATSNNTKTSGNKQSSGKTMTTVGKVRYLIDVQHVPAEKILLITFTRKAAESLSERLGEKKLKCRTFHKLALDIIGEATGEKPTITQPDFSVQVYHRLLEENPAFKAAITDYIIRSRYTMRDQFEYSSMEDYMMDRQKHGIQAFFKDMDGRPVFCKSDEESQICDFLGSRGIKFRYEEKYEVSTVDAEYRQYCPDFSIYIDGPDGQVKRIYLEHFAVNEAGRCPSFFSSEDEVKYQQGITWKRDLHHQNGTILLETSSAGFHRGDVFQVLSKQLLDLGAVFSKATQENVARELQRQEENILGMLTAFNFLLKSRSRSMDDIRREAGRGPDAVTLNDIVAPFVEAYRRMEEENNEIDFTDAIIRATDLCNNGHRPDYDYILVDEFQDISMDR